MSSNNTIPIKIPRPMNAFMCFAKYYRPLLKNQLKNSSNSYLSIELGNRWKQLSKEQQIVYKKQADDIKQQHIKKYPFYKYQPKTKKLKMPIRGKIETYKPSVPIFKKIHISKKVNIQSPDTETEDEEMDWFEYIQNENWLK